MSIVEVGDQINKRLSSESDQKIGLGLGKHSGVIQIINNLRAVGAAMEVDLPSIALCGQQSCGKSSLTEAICGVPMPRNAGTCTRCPTELRLIQRDGKFKCDVGIRYEYDDVKDTPLDKITERHIGSADSRLNVAPIVTRAQKHILDSAGLQFSRNVITVTIYDPHCLNLTILDLPGLIFAIEKKEDAKFIDLVKNLIVDTIKKPNTLIACVISCKDDMENQMINQLSRQYDPTGSRTIGILTKIDTIEHGLEQEWIKVLQNKKYPLKLGYVAVKNPNQQELMKNLSYQQTRRLEQQQFEKEPWSLLSEEIKERYGAMSLTRILSDTLGSLIVKQLPSMKEIIEHKLVVCQTELKQLPTPPFADSESPTEVLFATLTKYCDDVKNLVRMNDSDFWEDAMVELQRFQTKLNKIQPRFASGNKPLSKSNGKLMYSMKDVVEQKTKNRRRGIGCARKHFVQNSMNRWESITRDIVTNCSSEFAKHITQVSKQTLLPYVGLHRIASLAAMDLLEQVTEETMKHCLYLMERELKSDSTLSTQRLHATYTNALDQLCLAFNVEKKSEQQFNENEAIMIMANAIAYYDLAFRRFADVTAMAIEDLLFNGFVNKIDAVIRKKLNLFKATDEQILGLLQEDTSVADKRKKVLDRLNRLQSVAKELRIALPQNDVNNDLDLFAKKQKSNHNLKDNDDEQDDDTESISRSHSHNQDDQKEDHKSKSHKDKKKKKKFFNFIK